MPAEYSSRARYSGNGGLLPGVETVPYGGRAARARLGEPPGEARFRVCPSKRLELRCRFLDRSRAPEGKAYEEPRARRTGFRHLLRRGGRSDLEYRGRRGRDRKDGV